jgi:hypothetical protein
MNAHVHYRLTLQWALEEGLEPAEAEAVARANVAVDREYPGDRLRYKGWHFGWLGARRKARRLLAEAVRERDPVSLGRALHCEQDALAHGHLGHLLHYRGIDVWERRSERVRTRIEGSSRRMLGAYHTAQRASSSR